nr:MAG TPA: hypothetical protein [Caudoviricetes sp.]
MAEQVYLSIFDKTTGTRKTSYTILGQVHGSTMDELKQKAAADYPDDYAVPQTAEEYHNGISGDLRWNGDTYTDPPQPTAEELQAQALASLDSEYQSRFDELDEQIVKAAALKNTELQDELIAERSALAEEYTQKRGEL